MEKNKIKISVMVPIYNTSQYLEKCLKSIISQSLKEIEIICVNDGSTDNSLEILEKFSKEDERIVIINKKNGGLTSARNAALKIARGKYCLNIDSDDWIEQGYFKDVYERAEKDDLDILLTNIIFDYPNRKSTLNDLNLDDNTIINGKKYINIFFQNNKHGFTWNKLIKRELYVKNNFRYNENVFLLEDMELICKLGYCAKKIGKLNKAYYHYIHGIGNGSQKVKLKNLMDRIEVYSNLIAYFINFKEKVVVKEIKKERDISLLSEVIGKDFHKLDGYNEVLEKIIKMVKEDKNNISSDFYHTKYQVFTTKCIKKINFISPKVQIKVFKFISKLKNILTRSMS